MTYTLNERSIKNLKGVNIDLVEVVKKALKLATMEFTVVEGLRTVERQKQMVAEGKSKTMNSYHIPNEFGGRAVDLYPSPGGKVNVNAPPADYKAIADAMNKAAQELGVKITWGGTWKTLIDMPHYQIEEPKTKATYAGE